MQIEITQANRNDENNIHVLIKTAYGKHAMYKIPERWKWEYSKNPFYDDDKKLPICIARSDSRIVGQTCAMYVPLKIGTQIYQAAWGVDFIVLPEYRGRKLGKSLQEKMRSIPKIFMSVAMAEQTRSIKKKQGHLTATTVIFFRKFVKLCGKDIYTYFIKKTMRHPIIRKIITFTCKYLQIHRFLALTINILTKIRNIFNHKNKVTDIEMLEVKVFGDDIDLLWKKTCNQYDVIVRRDSQYLNWKFVAQPNLEFRRFIAKRDNTTTGFIILRKSYPPEYRIGHIVDLYADRNDKTTIDALIKFAAGWFGKDVSVIECATTISEYIEILCTNGFLPMEKHELLYYCADSNIVNKLKKLSNSWFIGKGDDDWDQYSPVEF